MIHTIKPEVLTTYLHHLFHRCHVVKNEIEKAYQLSEINQINEKREQAFFQCLPRFKPREEDINEQYLDDYFGNIEYIRARMSDFKYQKMPPSVTVDYEKIDLDRDLSSFLDSNFSEHGHYHEARNFLIINSRRPVYYTKFNDIFKKLEKMGLTSIHHIAEEVHLSKQEVQFLKDLENDLEKAENFLGIEFTCLNYVNCSTHFEDILPY